MNNVFDYDEDDFVVISTNPFRGPRPQEAAPRHLEAIEKSADEAGKEFWPVNVKIHDNPELGYKEFIAHEALTSFMKRQPGWKVTPSAYGLKTAWIAEYDSGEKGAVVSFNAEMGMDTHGVSC
jgi:hypothetical protein